MVTKKDIQDISKQVSKENEEKEKTNVSTTDCRTDVGITVGLIDGLIAIARVLRHQDLAPQEVKEALEDLKQDGDIEYILNYLKED